MGAEPLTAVGLASLCPDGVDESFAGLLQFPADVVATVHSGFRAAYRTWLEVAGADAVLRAPNVFRPSILEEIEIRDGTGARKVTVEDSSELFIRQIDDFVGAALDRRAPAVSLADSRGNAAALAALHQSAKSGRVVTI